MLCRQNLSGSPPKSGPLDFGTKIIFLLFSSMIGVYHIYIKKAIQCSPIPSFFLFYEPNLNFEVADSDQKSKIHRFCEACYVPQNTAHGISFPYKF